MAGDDDYEIPETGAVFTFGRSRFADNLPSHFFIRNDPVVEISCGDEHTALVCYSGRVFLFGHNDYGQLGFGHTKVVNKPSCLKYLKPFHSTHVACGKGHTLISTECNRLFTFGCNSDGQLGIGDLHDRVVPQMISTDLSEDEKILALSAGCHHSAFLTDKGNVYLWGSNSDGQCGVEMEEACYLLKPQKIEFEHPISSVSCGYYHTAFTSLGSTYTFGEEDNGKLGRKGKAPKSLPGKVDIPSKCVSVKCGGSHTLVLTESGVVYAFGSNFSGQLGIGNFEPDCSVPTQIEIPNNNEKIVYISCGESHSALVTSHYKLQTLITSNGVLYMCGDARHGKLCNEDESTNRNAPTLVYSLKNHFTTSVSCGGCHTMVLAKLGTPDGGEDLPHLQNTPDVLPPLKMKKDFLELENSVNEANVIEQDVEKQKEKHVENGENEEGDNKSNTESNLNNEEATSHLDEIYTEIQEIPSDRSESGESKQVEPDIVQNKTLNESNENDLVVVKKESTIKQLLNVFGKKKSISAILLNDKSEGKVQKPNAEETVKTGNQKRSRACLIL